MPYADNDKQKEYMKKWKEKNKEKTRSYIRTYVRKWRIQHKEYYNKKQKERRHKNKAIVTLNNQIIKDKTT